MFQPKNKSKALLLSINENCETLIKQTPRKAEQTLEFNLSNQKKPLISTQLYWLEDLE